MPIYDYRCSNCGHRAEILHGVHDETAHVCPECGGQMRKAITAPAVVFKGSGWAKVDRRSSSHRKSAVGDGETATPVGAVGASEGSSTTEATSSSDAGSGSTSKTTSQSNSESRSESRSDSRSGQRDRGSKGADPASGTKSKSSTGSD